MNQPERKFTMLENRPCRRFITTNQDEYQNPANVRVYRKIESDEIDRYDKCMKQKECEEQAYKNFAREYLCNKEQCDNREPVLYPTDSHISEEAKAKPSWCRCLPTGDPNCYEEVQEEKCTDATCYCKQIYRQMDPVPENSRQKIYSSAYFVDFREPTYNYIKHKEEIKADLNKKFQDYKAKVDYADSLKEPKIAAAPAEPEERVDPNCMGIYDSLPPAKKVGDWKPDETWWREETSDCVKNLVKKYVLTTTYREMNKDGAALPITVRETPESCIENPPGDPVKMKGECAPQSLYDLGKIFEEWDRPQIRPVAGRCDTINNRPCLEYDTYFKDQYLHRAKFARCPETHDLPSEENLKLATEDRLRMPYDKMIPGWMGYQSFEAPPICKIKKKIDPANPYEEFSTYQQDFINHPKEVYEFPVTPYKPENLEKKGIAMNPISTLSKIPLPCVHRLSCYLEPGKYNC